MGQTDLEARNKVFLGSFVHSKALNKLEYLHQTAVFVDKSGKIIAIEKDCDESKARELIFPRFGWAEADVEVVKAKEEQFFFPGFIGERRQYSFFFFFFFFFSFPFLSPSSRVSVSLARQDY